MRGGLPNSNSDEDDAFEDELHSVRPAARGSQGRTQGRSQRVPRADGQVSHARNTWNGTAGWSVYFPDEMETDESCVGRSKAVGKLKAFFLTPEGKEKLETIPTNSFAVSLDYQQLSRRSADPALRGIAAAIEEAPEDALASIGLAACRAAEQLSADELIVSRENRLWPRVYNFSPLTCMRTLRGNSVGKFIAVRGTVVRVSNIRQQLVSMTFECPRCGEKQFRSFVDYKYSIPTKCPGEKCRSRSFTPLRNTAETVDWQKIRIQELQDKSDDMSTREEGRLPRTIDAELFSDLIDNCIPGDIVTLCGIIRVLTIDGGGQNRSTKCLYYMYLEANSIVSNRTRNSSKATDTENATDEAETQVIHRVIREVVREKDPFGFLVHSAVPSIYGHEIVKAGLLLSLFGGAKKEKVGQSAGSETVSIRTDIHCLLVGDPGLGKSQLLKGMSNITPRGVYVCGNTASTAGLTVTVVRESSGDFALEAGALVLGDRGICCIDEFDKMGAEHGALLEAMEQQSVSVAKAGLLCNLSARTTVIAAANPVGGHYDRSRTVCENLKIALPLLSRFDLVFILMDRPDEDRDRFISEHVMNMFGMRSSERTSRSIWRKNGSASQRDCGSPVPESIDKEGGRNISSIIPSESIDVDSEKSHVSLKQRLRRLRVRDPLPPSLFRQYVAYAKAHVHPELSEGAKSELQEFYLTLRKTAHENSADTTPITTRQLESLIRLCEARARAVMRMVVTAEDARDVIEIMRESMIETLTDETGALDLGRSSGMSRSKDARRFISALHAEAARTRSALFDKASLRSVAERIGVSGERFETMVETVNYQGFLTKKGARLWELQSSSYAQNKASRSSANQTQNGRCSPSGTQGRSQISQERRERFGSQLGGRKRRLDEFEYD